MKTNNKLTQWTTSSYNISDSLLTKNLLTQYINIFWNDLFSTLPIPLGQGQEKDQYISLLVILNYNGKLKTLGNVHTIKYSDLTPPRDELTLNLIAILKFKSDNYHSKPITSIQFKYILLSDETVIENSIILETKNPVNYNTTKLFGSYLPNSAPLSSPQGRRGWHGQVMYIFIIFFAIFYISLSLSYITIYNCVLYGLTIIISLAFSLFISSIYNWSDNFFIRTVQKSIFYTFLSLLGVLLLNYLGIYIFDVIHCDSDDEDIINSDTEDLNVKDNNNKSSPQGRE